MFNIGDKLTKENYTQGAIWCNENNAAIEEIDGEYVIVAIPEPEPLTREQINDLRIAYRKEKIDDRTIARMRKQANGTWTEEDEAEYLKLDDEVTAYIEENYPYPEEPEIPEEVVSKTENTTEEAKAEPQETVPEKENIA